MTKKIITCADCGEKKKHNAKGLCANCYKKTRPPQKRTIKKCTSCERVRRIRGYGLCYVCLGWWHKQGEPDLKSFHHTIRKQRSFPFPCERCGEQITHSHNAHGKGYRDGGKYHAKNGLCQSCDSFVSTAKENNLDISVDNKRARKPRSMPEEKMDYWLKIFFGQENVWREQKLPEYPFQADFYIPTKNIIIEYNGYWSHGGEFYDKNNPEHLQKLALWKEKASSGSETYKRAIKTWTHRDLLKRDTAKENGIEFHAFYDRNLGDFFSWLSSYCDLDEATLFDIVKNVTVVSHSLLGQCSSCKQQSETIIRGMCKWCHSAWRRAGKPMPVENFRFTPKYLRPKPECCSSCGDKKIYSNGLCKACYAAWKRSGRPSLSNFTYKPLSQRTFNRDKICISCQSAPVNANSLCTNCYSAWRRAGKPQPVEDFRYTPQNLRTPPLWVPKNCTSCNKIMKTKQEYASRGLCSPCYQQWLKQRQKRKPQPVKNFQYKPSHRDVIPKEQGYHTHSCFPSRKKGEGIGKCGACKREGLRHHLRGMCEKCYRAWIRKGKPLPVSDFFNDFFSKPPLYPRQCSSRQQTVNTEKQYGAYGMCRSCYQAWSRNGRPQPVSEFRYTTKQFLTYPAQCTSCNEIIATYKEHRGYGLCERCYGAWARKGKPQPVNQFKHPRLPKRVPLVFPRKCTSCNGEIPSMKEYSAHGMCRCCYDAWYRANRPQPVSEFRYTPIALRAQSSSANK